MMELYATSYFVFNEFTSRVTHQVMYMTATSEDEASGKTYSKASREFPSADGWRAPVISIVRIQHEHMRDILSQVQP